MAQLVEDLHMLSALGFYPPARYKARYGGKFLTSEHFRAHPLEEGESKAKGHPQLCCDFETCLGYMKCFLK